MARRGARLRCRDWALSGTGLVSKFRSTVWLPGLLLAPLAGFPERGHPLGLATEVEPAQDEVEGARHHGLGVLIAQDAAAAGDDVVVQLPGRMVLAQPGQRADELDQAAARVSGWSSPRTRRRRARVSSSSCTWALLSSPAIPALSPRRRVRAKLPPSTSCSACERLWLQSGPVHDRKWPVAWLARSEGLEPPTFRSVDSCTGVRPRSGQFTTSGALLSVIRGSPENKDVVRPCGSQRGSRPCSTPGTSAPRIEPELSAWESDRSWPMKPLTSQTGRPGVAVIDRSSPRLIAR